MQPIEPKERRDLVSTWWTSAATLNEIKASSGNDMARVNAVKTLEQLKDGIVDETGGGVTRLVVQIVDVAGEVTKTIGAQPACAVDRHHS
jgi:hypothetical protein